MTILRIIICVICCSLTCCSKPKLPEPKNEKLILVNQISKSCAKTLSQRHQMSQSGDGGAIMYEVKELFLAFQIYRSLSKEEARAILLDCANEVITAVNNNKEIQKYLLPGGFTEKNVEIHLYIKPNHKKNYYPDIGVCSYDFGNFSYQTYDPDNKYVYKTNERETFDEAIALLNHPKTTSSSNEKTTANTANQEKAKRVSSFTILDDSGQPIIEAQAIRHKQKTSNE